MTYFPFLATEQDRVDSWRLRQLLDAGYPLLTAELIAASSADLHQALELVEAGCDPKVAADILL